MLSAGSWLFRHRGWTPLPLLLFQLIGGEQSSFLAGSFLVVLGEFIRFWAVGHIGARSRTRGAEVGGLVETGPFGRCRNPLYVGNGLLLVGVGCWSGPVWALAWFGFVALQYTVVVRWEESVLLRTHGRAYRDYCSRVPRWLPMGSSRSTAAVAWGAALRSERPTLTAIAAVTLAFWSPVFFG